MELFVTNRKIIYGLPFEDYLKLDGTSHSDIRMEGREKFEPTAKMNFGTDVHNYLLEPSRYHHSNVAIVKPIAMKLKSVVGELWRFLKTEIAVQADFTVDGLTMKYRGRIDLGIVGKIIIDIKVINGKSVRDTIDFFHYDTQLPGYALGLGANKALILAYSTKTKEVEIVDIPITVDWWAQQTLTRGIPKL